MIRRPHARLNQQIFLPDHGSNILAYIGKCRARGAADVQGALDRGRRAQTPLCAGITNHAAPATQKSGKMHAIRWDGPIGGDSNAGMTVLGVRLLGVRLAGR